MCNGWIKLVPCLSVIGTMIGLNMVLVRSNSIKVLWCCLYVVLSWEIDVDMIVSEYHRRRQICFKRS